MKRLRNISVGFLLIALFIFILGWNSIGEKDSLQLIKRLIPPSIKTKLTESIYLVPALRWKINQLRFALDHEDEAKHKLIYSALQHSHRYFDIYRQNIPCPKSANVILVAGQSNAANFVSSLEYENKFHVNHFASRCYPLQNPVFGATGYESSVVPAIASKLTSRIPHIFIAAAWGGTHVRDWSRDDSELTRYANLQLKQLNTNGHKLSAVIWMQGEADYNESGLDYKSHFNKMRAKLLEGISIEQNFKLVITQSTRCGGPRSEALNSHQRELGKDANTYVTEVTDSLGASFRRDGCHLNELGTEAVAKEISSILNG